MIGPRKFKEIVHTMLRMVSAGDEIGAFAYVEAQNLNETEYLAVFRFLGHMLNKAEAA